MKISKSKQELARIISENGGWRDSAEFAWYGNQTKKGWFGISKPWYSPKQKSLRIVTTHIAGSFSCEKMQNWHQTILSRAEYFHLYSMPDADGWIEWKGVPRSPVSKGTQVDVKMQNGTQHFGQLIDDECWSDCWGDASIIAYRLHKQEKYKPEFCESVMRSIPEPEAKPTIEQLAADYRNAKDHADRKQQEADAAKADADEKLRVLEIAGEALGLLVSPITEKQEPGLVINDWRQLKVGDLVEITTTRDGVNIGEAATIIAIDENNENFPVTVTFPEDKYPLEYSYERPPTTWRFIRRP